MRTHEQYDFRPAATFSSSLILAACLSSSSLKSTLQSSLQSPSLPQDCASSHNAHSRLSGDCFLFLADRFLQSLVRQSPTISHPIWSSRTIHYKVLVRQRPTTANLQSGRAQPNKCTPLVRQSPTQPCVTESVWVWVRNKNVPAYSS